MCIHMLNVHIHFYYFNISTFIYRYFLSTESEQLVWKGEGLPSDDLSVENALVILQVGYGRCNQLICSCN